MPSNHLAEKEICTSEKGSLRSHTALKTIVVHQLTSLRGAILQVRKGKWRSVQINMQRPGLTTDGQNKDGTNVYTVYATFNRPIRRDCLFLTFW